MTAVPVRLLAVASALALALTGCGGDTADSPEAVNPPADAVADPAGGEAPDEGAPEEEASEEAPEAPADTEASGAARGTVVVDGMSYEITEVRRCEPYDDGVVDRELELQGLGKHDGERVQIDVYVQEMSGAPFDDVSWAGPEGIFGGPEDADVTYDSAGGSVRGAATLVDAFEQVEHVSVTFDLEVPAETVACR